MKKDKILTDMIDPLFTFARQAAIYQSGSFNHNYRKPNIRIILLVLLLARAVILDGETLFAREVLLAEEIALAGEMLLAKERLLVGEMLFAKSTIGWRNNTG